MALTAERVQQLLGWRGKIKTVVHNLPPSDTEVRLQLDQILFRRP
jgi:hypothetical protein